MSHTTTEAQSPWLSADALAAYLDVSVASVRAWRYRGIGPAGHKIGRHVRYHRDEVDRWVLSDAKVSA